MKTKVLLSIVVIFSVCLILFLLGSNTETWNSVCTYKREFGIFSYYREADNSIAGNVCGEAGVIFSGVLKTILASMAVFFIARFSWVKLTENKA